MRSDMAKVIVERPRHGHANGFIPDGKLRQLTDDDGEPLGFFARDHIRTRKTKSLNENLAPLRRYLESQVGRAWNDLRSDICEHLRPSSTVQQHVLDHILDFVAITVWREGDALWTMNRWRGPMRLGERGQRLYVDPDTGKLERNPFRILGRRVAQQAEAIRRAAEVAARMRVISRWCQWHHLDNGLWFELALTAVPDENTRWHNEACVRNDALDVVLQAGLTARSRADLYQRFGVVAAAKRQLSGRTLHKAGIV